MSLEMWSDDRRYGLRLEDEILADLRRQCAGADGMETGGVLVGHYSGKGDCAVVTEVVPAPPDSERGRTWFKRGIRGLRALFIERWEHRHQVYLGEWHFHPGVEPEPSGQDQAQIRDLAASASVACSVPILLVVGSPTSTDFAVDAWVAPRGQQPIRLQV